MQEKNFLLRRERLRRGWSQTRLSVEAKVSLSTVERAERGLPLRIDNIQLLCSCLGKDPVQLGLLKLEGDAQEGNRQSVDTTQHESSKGNLGYSTTQKDSNDQMPEISGSGSNEMDRRTFLRDSLVVAGAAIVAPNSATLDPEPWERFSKALQRPSTIDEITLSHLEDLAQSSWQLIPDISGIASHHLRDDVIEHLNEVTDLLEVSHPDVVHKRLCSIGGEFAMIAASMSSNLRDFDKAQSYYRTSIEGAREAGNHSLEAVGLASLAIRLTHLGNPDKALPLVQEARHLATQKSTPTTRTWLAAVEAEVQANLQERDACFRALDDAALVPQSIPPGEDPYMTTFGPSLFAGYSGVCHMKFDEPQDAYNVLRDALAHLATPSISRRCYILTDLVSACIKRGEIAEACSYAHQALTLTAQAKSPALWERISDISQQLEPWKGVTAVKDFQERLHFVLHTKTRSRN